MELLALRSRKVKMAKKDKKTDLEDQIIALQDELARLNAIPTDNFALGSVLKFQTTLQQWLVEKMSTDLWLSHSTRQSKSLAEWVLIAEDANIGGFNLYEMTQKNNPFFSYTPLP